MKAPCIDALCRIFMLCDRDRNGFLSDLELNDFQRKCFGTPLQRQELEGIKTTGSWRSSNIVPVNQGDPAFTSPEKGLSRDGFLFLNTLFIQKGRLETTWQILRSFGYGDDLSLREDFLVPPSLAKLQSESEANHGSIELSRDGYAFFTELFQSFDTDNDGALNSQELEELFSTAPTNPFTQSSGFPHSTITNASGICYFQFTFKGL